MLRYRGNSALQKGQSHICLNHIWLCAAPPEKHWSWDLTRNKWTKHLFPKMVVYLGQSKCTKSEQEQIISVGEQVQSLQVEDNTLYIIGQWFWAWKRALGPAWRNVLDIDLKKTKPWTLTWPDISSGILSNHLFSAFSLVLFIMVTLLLTFYNPGEILWHYVNKRSQYFLPSKPPSCGHSYLCQQQRKKSMLQKREIFQIPELTASSTLI